MPPLQRAKSVQQPPDHQMRATEHLDDDIAVESTDNPLAASAGGAYRPLDRTVLDQTQPQVGLPRQHSEPTHAPPPRSTSQTTGLPRATSERSVVTMAAVEEDEL